MIKSNNGITIINKAGEKAATIYPVREGATVKTAAADTPAGNIFGRRACTRPAVAVPG